MTTESFSCADCAWFRLNGDGIFGCTQPFKGNTHSHAEYKYDGYAACKASLPLGERPPHFLFSPDTRPMWDHWLVRYLARIRR
jgi:hypothetical protein